MRLEGRLICGMDIVHAVIGFGPVGSYIDLSNYYTKREIDTGKQDKLVSGTNIRTINGNSVLGSGNINIQGSAVQSDWNETDASSMAYIKNKPTIPTVPTNVGAFTNDAGYLTQHQSIKTLNGTSLLGSGDVSTETPVIEVTGATPTQTLAPNTFYKFTGQVTSLTLTLGTAITGITNIYAFSFTAGADNPTISLPASVTIDGTPSISAGNYVEFSIMNNVAFFKVVSI